MDVSEDIEGLIRPKAAPIRTDRLTLRLPTLDDVSWLCASLCDMRIAAQLTSIPVPFERHHAVTWITQDRVPGSARIIERDGRAIGVVHIGPDLVYWLTPDAWGRGYALEAAAALTDWHFRSTHALNLVSGYAVGNELSSKILANLGFQHGGLEPRRCNVKGGAVTVQSMSLSRETWEARRTLPYLETHRLRLRPHTEDDATCLADLAGVPEVAPMIFRAKIPWPMDEVRQFIRDWAWTGTPHFRLAITLKDDTLIGSVGISLEPHVFYFFHKDHWGRGYASEVMRAFLRANYDRFPQLDEIGADVFQENTASAGVLGKLGFVQTGTDLGTSAARVEPAPVNVYRLTRTNFRDIP